MDWEENLFDFYVEPVAFRIKILSFFHRTPLVGASEPKSNISNTNPNKNNKCSCSGPPSFKSGSCRLRFS